MTLQTVQSVRTVAPAVDADRRAIAVPVTEGVYGRIRAREREHPELVEDVLRALVDFERVVEVDDDHRSLATSLVDRRAADDLERFRRCALTTRQVTERVAELADRRSVDARRRRGQLLGVTVGRDSWHPDWQFGAGRTRPRLGEVLGALRSTVGEDGMLADLVMRTPRDELNGASLAELYAAGRTDEVLRSLQMRGEGFVA